MEVMAIRWMTTAKKLMRERHGTAAVEFVLILPVLAVLLLGPIEIGRLESHYQVASDGVRDAGRFLSQVPVDCSTGVGAGTFVNDPADLDNAENLAKTGSIGGGGNDLVSGWGDAATTFVATVNCENNTVPLVGLYQSCTVIPTVTVTVSMRFNFLGSMPYLPLNLDLPVAHTEVNTSSDSTIQGC